MPLSLTEQLVSLRVMPTAPAPSACASADACGHSVFRRGVLRRRLCVFGPAVGTSAFGIGRGGSAPNASAGGTNKRPPEAALDRKASLEREPRHGTYVEREEREATFADY
jgi:hypothetical protein